MHSHIDLHEISIVICRDDPVSDEEVDNDYGAIQLEL